jgi:peptidyl-prolyl cis-trans isomerase D
LFLQINKFIANDRNFKKFGGKKLGGLILIIVIIIAFGFGGFGGGFSTNNQNNIA